MHGLMLSAIVQCLMQISMHSEDKKDATRSSSGIALNRLAAKVPNLFGGSADLAPSNKTNIKDAGDFSSKDYTGSNIHFGVREFAMAAAANGIYLHGGLTPYVATFFVFSDYLKPAYRLSALMGPSCNVRIKHMIASVLERTDLHISLLSSWQ